MISTTILSLLALALLVLPGLGVRVILRCRSRPPVEELLQGVAVTALVIALVAVVLLGFSVFTPTRAGIMLALVSIPGAGRLARSGAHLLRRPTAYLVALLAIPFAWTTTLSGAPPARTFQWYYWNLGSQLSTAGGIPSSVREYGRAIRWLPDYVVFNAVSEAYRGLAPFGSATSQVVAWRVPLALLGVGAAYLMLRLWVSRPAALVGVVALVPSTWFVLKFNAYKPEAYGGVLGLVAVSLAIIGLRQGRRSTVVIAGALLGVDLAVHAIAATAFIGLVGSAAIVEIVSARGLGRRLPEAKRGRARAAWISLAAAAALGLAVTAGIGWTLQGRALVFADATHPARSPDGSDPTLVYSRFSSGDYTPNPKTDLPQELATNLTEPWADFTIGPGLGVALGALIIVGITLAVRGPDRRPRCFLVALIGFALILSATAFYSALAYNTFVPRHTGLSRLAQYSPLVLSGLAAIAVHGYGTVLAQRIHARDTRVLSAAAYALGVIAVVGSALATSSQLAKDSPISRDGEAALATLARQASKQEIILGNVGTRGLLSFRSGAQSLLEGRQPFLEKASFLTAANRLYLEAHEFFTTPQDSTFTDRYGVDWIVVATTPAELGVSNSYGVPPPDWYPRGFALDYESGGVRLFHRVGATDAAPTAVGPARELGSHTVLVLAGLAAASAAAWLVLTRRRRAA